MSIEDFLCLDFEIRVGRKKEIMDKICPYPVEFLLSTMPHSMYIDYLNKRAYFSELLNEAESTEYKDKLFDLIESGEKENIKLVEQLIEGLKL